MRSSENNARIENDLIRSIEYKILQKLTDAETSVLNKWIFPVQLGRKERIVSEGEVCRTAYFIESGATHTAIFNLESLEPARMLWIGPLNSMNW